MSLVSPQPTSLEDKLTRLQEIQQLLEQRKVNLSESIPLLEEAYKLKRDIEQELQAMENKLIQLSKTGDQDVYQAQ
jgi:exodeoxyribonuclease VII small subunit